MLVGLKYVHKLKVLHRDLKTSNMFLSSNFIIKIGDFGISKILHDTNENAETFVGTPYYLSPEICKNLPYSYKSDVWSLGCILYELCNLEHAFHSNNLIGLAKKIEFEQPKKIIDLYSKGLSELIFSMLEKDFEKRPKIEEIFQFKVIKGFLEGYFDFRGGVKNDCFFVKKENSDLTPKQRLLKKKMDKAKKREEEILNCLKKNQKAIGFDKYSHLRSSLGSKHKIDYKKKISLLEEYSPQNSYENEKNFSIKNDKNKENYKDSFLDDTVQSINIGNDNFCGDTVNSVIIENEDTFKFKEIQNLNPKIKKQKKIIFKMNSESDSNKYHSEESIDYQASFEDIS